MDKKLNEVTKVTDMAYVPVIMSDGSIGQIAKADLASVVAGIMNTSKLFPFMSMSQAPSGDLNNIQTPGTYYLSSMGDYTNNPGFGWGLLVVFKTLYTTQIAIQSTSQQVVLRTYDGTNWSSWVHLDNFGFNSLADLAAGVEGVISPFKILGQKDSSFNLDDFKENGMIYGLNLVNAPISESTNVIYVCFSYKNVMAWQMAKKYSGESIYVRSWGHDLGWSSWKTIVL